MNKPSLYFITAPREKYRVFIIPPQNIFVHHRLEFHCLVNEILKHDIGQAYLKFVYSSWYPLYQIQCFIDLCYVEKHIVHLIVNHFALYKTIFIYQKYTSSWIQQHIMHPLVLYVCRKKPRRIMFINMGTYRIGSKIPDYISAIYHLGPLLLTCFNFNPSMDK